MKVISDTQKLMAKINKPIDIIIYPETYTNTISEEFYGKWVSNNKPVTVKNGSTTRNTLIATAKVSLKNIYKYKYNNVDVTEDVEYDLANTSLYATPSTISTNDELAAISKADISIYTASNDMIIFQCNGTVPTIPIKLTLYNSNHIMMNLKGPYVENTDPVIINNLTVEHTLNAMDQINHFGSAQLGIKGTLTNDYNISINTMARFIAIKGITISGAQPQDPNNSNTPYGYGLLINQGGLYINSAYTYSSGNSAGIYSPLQSALINGIKDVGTLEVLGTANIVGNTTIGNNSNRSSLDVKGSITGGGNLTIKGASSTIEHNLQVGTYGNNDTFTAYGTNTLYGTNNIIGNTIIGDPNANPKNSLTINANTAMGNGTILTVDRVSGLKLEDIPKGAVSEYKVVQNETARLALTRNDVQTGDVVLQEDTNIMYYVKDDSKLGTSDAFKEFSAGIASKALSVDWSGVQNKPSSYYTHPSYTARGKKLYKIAVDDTGHVNDITEVTKDDIIALGISEYTALPNPYSLTIGYGFIGFEDAEDITYNLVYDGSNPKTLNILAGQNIDISANTNGNSIIINNTGVGKVSTGTENGTISVTTNGTTSNVAVKGLGSAAYTESSKYAISNHNHNSIDLNLSVDDIYDELYTAHDGGVFFSSFAPKLISAKINPDNPLSAIRIETRKGFYIGSYNADYTTNDQGTDLNQALYYLRFDGNGVYYSTRFYTGTPESRNNFYNNNLEYKILGNPVDEDLLIEAYPTYYDKQSDSISMGNNHPYIKLLAGTGTYNNINQLISVENPKIVTNAVIYAGGPTIQLNNKTLKDSITAELGTYPLKIGSDIYPIDGTLNLGSQSYSFNNVYSSSLNTNEINATGDNSIIGQSDKHFNSAYIDNIYGSIYGSIQSDSISSTDFYFKEMYNENMTQFGQLAIHPTESEYNDGDSFPKYGSGNVDVSVVKNDYFNYYINPIIDNSKNNIGKISFGYIDPLYYIEDNIKIYDYTTTGFTIGTSFRSNSSTILVIENNSIKLVREVNDTIYKHDVLLNNRNIIPDANNTRNIGTSSLKYNNIYATSFNGALSGNASTATNATNDKDGNAIDTTYLKRSGGTMTGTIITNSDDNIHIRPNADNNGNIGTSDYKYSSIHGNELYTYKIIIDPVLSKNGDNDIGTIHYNHLQGSNTDAAIMMNKPISINNNDNKTTIPTTESNNHNWLRPVHLLTGVPNPNDMIEGHIYAVYVNA